MPKRVLFVTHEMLPFDDGPASGGGLRVWGLSKGLEARGFEVTVSMPRKYLENRPDVPSEILEAAYDTRHIATLISRFSPDVLVLEQPRSLVWFENLDVPTVIDLPGPVFLEDRHIREGSQEEVLDKIHSLSYGDLFLTSHERQKSYFLSWLALAGVDLMADRVRVVPFCLPPDGAPARDRSEEPTFVYSGYFHTWQDPVAALVTLVELLEERGVGRLEVVGGRHPADIFGEGRYQDPRDQLPTSDRITFHDPMPWNRLCQLLATGWVGLNLLAPNVERENAFPIREINYLWCGLPPLVSPTSPLGPELITRGAGWVVDPASPDQLRELIGGLLDDPARIDRASQAARALARERYSWDHAVEPLAAFCADPVRRRGKGRSFLAAATDRQQLVSVAEELGQVAAAQQQTERELERRNAAFADLERELAAARRTLDEQVAATEQATAQIAEHAATVSRLVTEQEALHGQLEQRTEALEAGRREQSTMRAALEQAQGTVAHKEEVVRRLTGDLEHHRRRVGELEGQLHGIQRKYAYRVYRKLRPLGRPAGLALIGALLLGGLWLAAPGLFDGLARFGNDHPVAFGLATAVALVCLLAALYKLRRHLPDALSFKWRWLTPTRARWLGAIKLAFLFLLSLVLMVYLKVWERIHRIRVFP